MAIPQRFEQHVLACALCGHQVKATNIPAAQKWLSEHVRVTHRKKNSYTPDAVRTITIIYQANGDEDQSPPLDTIDPTSQFLKTITWMTEKDLL